MPYVLRVTDAKPVAVEALEVSPLLDALRPMLAIKTVKAWADALHALLDLAVIDLPETGGTVHLPDATVIRVERQPDGFDVDAFNARHS